MKDGAAKEAIIGWAVIAGVLLLGFFALRIRGEIETMEHSAYERGYKDALAAAEEQKNEEWLKGYERGREQFFVDLMDSEDFLLMTSDFFEAGVECARPIQSGEDDIELFTDYYLRYEFKLLNHTREPRIEKAG